MWAKENGLREVDVSVAMPSLDDEDDVPYARRIYRGEVDYSKKNMSYKKALEAEAEWLSNQGTGNEFMSIMTKDKKILATWEGYGRKTKVKGAELVELLQGYSYESVDFIHCHLGGTLFSQEDINFMCQVPYLKRNIIALPDGTLHYLSVGTGTRPEVGEINTRWKSFRWINEMEILRKEGRTKLLSIHKKEAIMKTVMDMIKEYHWDRGSI